jgi:hypothetical protein
MSGAQRLSLRACRLTITPFLVRAATKLRGASSQATAKLLLKGQGRIDRIGALAAAH